MALEGYPVFTHKAYTDVCYLACAKRLLKRRDLVFPQFATHNAHTLSAVYHMAGPEFKAGDYEFQCLHGMGETLYGHVVGAGNLGRPCRIYAPVGTHETLLAYLVRRLLENGANSSFVHQLADEKTPIADLTADPAEEAAKYGGAPHPAIVLPQDLFGGERRNSKGLDLSDARVREKLERAFEESRAADVGSRANYCRAAAAGMPRLRGRSSIPQTMRILWAMSRMPARLASRTQWLPRRHPPRNGRGPAPRSAPQCWSGGRICWSIRWSGFAS